ncbi:MAG: type I-E CRISPR-associated protein Cas6/Cse3/CasE [Candidatus Nanopelagicales bacterium]
MQLTRIEINPQRRESARLLASPHRVHAAVLSCFPPSGSPRRPLWRLDQTQGGMYLYVLSDTACDPTGFVELYGWPLSPGWVQRDYTPLLEMVDAGRRFSFRLRANPVHSVRSADMAGSGRGRRVAHVTADQQLGWLVQRSAGWGFDIGTPEVPSAMVVHRRTWEFWRSRDTAGARRGDRVTIATATFEGDLRVTDADRLRAQLVAGFGSAKGYGCGLMTLAPPR